MYPIKIWTKAALGKMNMADGSSQEKGQLTQS
jgi:hypothetical protein